MRKGVSQDIDISLKSGLQTVSGGKRVGRAARAKCNIGRVCTHVVHSRSRMNIAPLVLTVMGLLDARFSSTRQALMARTNLNAPCGIPQVA